MGEARRKREAHEERLERFPTAFTAAVRSLRRQSTICRPNMMFKGRQRPDGLIFPACDDCNQGTRHSDLVASMLGRLYPDAADPTEKSDVIKTISAVKNNMPGLLEEMHLGEAEQELARSISVGAGFLRLSGPLVTNHMTVFAAKLGLALFFDATGKALPASGNVVPFWFSNVQSLQGKIPLEFIRALPESKTLAQGKKSVADQFQYSQVVSPEHDWAGFFATFRFSFAAGCVVSMDPLEIYPRRQHWPLVLPLATLVYLLFSGYTPIFAGTMGLALTIVADPRHATCRTHRAAGVPCCILDRARNRRRGLSDDSESMCWL